jgi:cobyrinic acid a,c-diamide synthase
LARLGLIGLVSRAGHRIPALIVSATHSGAGKTVVATALARGLRESGLRVQPFKLGPDFIDTAYLSEAAGRNAVNLDTWMMGADGVRDSFQRWSEGADIALIEAMGALYDGADGGQRGSAAEAANLLGVPVVVVLDVWGMTRTTGAVMLGMRDFDPAVRIAGFILNRVGGDAHREMVEAGLPEELRALVLGAVRHHDSLLIPERHLGLLTVSESQGSAEGRRIAQRRAASGIDLLRLTELADADVRRSPARPPDVAAPARARLAIARDEAFCFYYEDNLRLLTEAGFELLAFSPIGDRALPAGADAVYLGGGYPESFAAALADNAGLSGEIRARAAKGMPIYAECGGLLYLGDALTDCEGQRHRMSGILPFEATMDPAHLAISYAEVRTRHDSPLGPAGTVARGQEFHQSRIVPGAPEPELFDLTTSAGETGRTGFLQRNVAAAYIHLHFGSCPALAPNLVGSARDRSRTGPIAARHA